MKTLVRFILYLIGFSFLTCAVTLILYWYGYGIILKENGPIEWIEALWLSLSSLFLFLAARKSVQYSRLYAVLWLLPLAAAARELDAVFDDILFHGAWAIPAWFILLVCLYRTFKSRSILKTEILEFAQTQQAVFLGLGFFIVAVFAQTFGQQAVMRAVFQEYHMRSIGGFIEEIIEFLGYVILVIGSFECYLRCHRLGQAEE